MPKTKPVDPSKLSFTVNVRKPSDEARRVVGGIALLSKTETAARYEAHVFAAPGVVEALDAGLLELEGLKQQER